MQKATRNCNRTILPRDVLIIRNNIQAVAGYSADRWSQFVLDMMITCVCSSQNLSHRSLLVL